MAHEIEVVNGVASMMFVGEMPWHKLGKAFVTPPTLEEAIVAAGLDWKVGTKPLFTAENVKVPALATYRESDDKILGVVGPAYHPLQNSEAFDFFKPFIDSGEVSIESAGSLRGGQRVWVLAKIKRDPMVVKGNDVIEKYMLLSNSHDGTMAVRTGFTGTRVVCANTFRIAVGSKESKLLRIKHTKNVVQALAMVQEVINAADQSFTATLQQYQLLASKGVNAADLEKYVRTVLALKSEESKVLGKVTTLFEKGRGNDMAEIKGTWWAALNAVSEYLQYEKGNNPDTRLDSLWFGQSGTVLEKAQKTAVEMAIAA